jgi:antitoxin component YwqK of YwqJK toxin-antitoxin module
MCAKTIIFFAVATTALAGCPKRHTGGPGTPHGNNLLLSRTGYPSFANQANRCPSRNGEGSIELSFDSGGKRVKGKCAGGIMVGDWKAWYTNGAVVWKASFKHGLLHGTFRSWHANDNKMAIAHYSEGIADGSIETWHHNGKKREKGKYLGGKPAGCWTTWHDNGEKASKGAYNNGAKVGTWTYWTASGSKRKEKLGGETAQGKCGLF